MTGAVLALLAGLFCGQLVAGEVQETQTAGETAAAVLLLFDEEEPGTGTYPVRYLVTDDFLRIDDNYDASDYVLLDRQTSTIYSVSHEYGNVLVSNRQPAVTQPDSLELTREPVPDELQLQQRFCCSAVKPCLSQLMPTCSKRPFSAR